MLIAGFLTDCFERIREGVHDVVDGLSPEDLAFRPTLESNSIAWLVWHLTRVQDDHVCDMTGTPQAWTSQGWFERFALPFAAEATGYGHGPPEVAVVQPGSGTLLLDYHDAVFRNTTAYVATLTESELDRIVDERWDPPVSLGVRMVSVVSDDLQHVGQAAYLRGLARSRSL